MADMAPHRQGEEVEWLRAQIDFCKGWNDTTEHPLPAPDVIYFYLLNLDQLRDAYQTGKNLALRMF